MFCLPDPEFALLSGGCVQELNSNFCYPQLKLGLQALQRVFEEIIAAFRGMFDRIARIQCSFGASFPSDKYPSHSTHTPNCSHVLCDHRHV